MFSLYVAGRSIKEQRMHIIRVRALVIGCAEKHRLVAFRAVRPARNLYTNAAACQALIEPSRKPLNDHRSHAFSEARGRELELHARTRKHWGESV
jgi:hypothetical protein